MYSVPTSCAHTVLNDFVIGLIGITCRLPTCAVMSPLSVIQRLGVCILSALNWYPLPKKKKNPKAPKSLWAISSSQGYDSSQLGFSSSENSNPFPLNPGQAICLRLFSSHLQDISPKLADKDSLCIFVHSVLGEVSSKSPVGDRRWSSQTPSHPPRHPCHNGHTLNLSLRLNLVGCFVTTTWNAIECCPVAHFRLASQIFHYKFI